MTLSSPVLFLAAGVVGFSLLIASLAFQAASSRIAASGRLAALFVAVFLITAGAASVGLYLLAHDALAVVVDFF